MELQIESSKTPLEPNQEPTIQVLHVDDEEAFTKSTKQILELQGSFQVETASSVREALKKIRRKSYDAIVSDYQMPERNGLELLKELRGEDNDIPFILFTGKGREEVAIEALNLGADYYVNKLGNPETIYGELAHTVTRVVKQQRTENALHLERERLETVTQNMGAGLVIISKDFRILWVNNVMREVFGDDYEGKICYTLINQLKSTCSGCGVKEVFEKGKDRIVHEQIVKGRDGQNVWLEITATPIRNNRGEITSVLELVNNVTERKKTEEELKKEAQIRVTLLDNLPCMAMVLKKGTREIVASNKRARKVGAIPGETCYRTCADRSDICPFCLAPKLWESNEPQSLDVEYRGKWYRGIWVPYTEDMYVHYIFDITEQKRVEKKLRQSEEKYRKQFEEALDAIFLGDAETGIILDCNHAATKLVGRKKSEIVGKHQKILHPPEEVEGEFSRTFRQHLTDKEGKILETQILTKNGEIKDVAIKANTFKMGDKQIVQGIFRDITEYKKIERALKESEAKYKSIIEQAPDLIVTLDAKGIVLSCNPALESEIGYDQNKIIGKHFLETPLLSGIDPVYAQKQFTTIIEGENPEPIEVNWFPKDGTPRISEIRVGLIRKEGKVAGFTAVARDITERQRLKKALQESEERFRQVAENSLEWIWEVDPDGLYTYASPAVEKLLGYEPNEIVGKKHFYDFFHPEHRENLKKSAFSVFEEKSSFNGFINPNVDRDGNLVWLSTSGVPMLDDKGNLLGYRGADIDVTDRKKAEEEVEKMVTDLSLVIEKLGVVGKASRHDARNKLSIIANNVYLAKQQLAKNSPALEYLDNVESATEQIKKIFDFARTYETIGVEEKSYVDVEKSFNEAVKLTSALGDTKIVNVCHGLTVLADSQLRQLFYNLINNSLTHGGNVTKIKLHCKIEKSQLKLIYEDDGVGISKLEKEKIFMEGYGKGTGYGLYLIRKICESYSWTIQETGKLRNGAQFTITVPKLIKDGKPTYHIDGKTMTAKVV